MLKGDVLHQDAMKAKGSSMPGKNSTGDPVRDTLDLWLFCRQEKGEALMRQSSSKRDAEGFPSEKAAEAGYTAVAKRTLEAFAARRRFWNSWRLEGSAVPAAPSFKTFQDLSCS